eukprot:763148-Hanusia_phi.AAC.3
MIGSERLLQCRSAMQCLGTWNFPSPAELQVGTHGHRVVAKQFTHGHPLSHTWHWQLRSVQVIGDRPPDDPPGRPSLPL